MNMIGIYQELFLLMSILFYFSDRVTRVAARFEGLSVTCEAFTAAINREFGSSYSIDEVNVAIERTDLELASADGEIYFMK